MNRRDFLWAGLNLLGVYFLVSGCVETAVAYLLGRHPTPRWVPDGFEELAYRQMVMGGFTVVGGVVLIFAAWLVGRTCRVYEQAADYAEPNKTTSPAAPPPP